MTILENKFIPTFCQGQLWTLNMECLALSVVIYCESDMAHSATHDCQSVYLCLSSTYFFRPQYHFGYAWEILV